MRLGLFFKEGRRRKLSPLWSRIVGVLVVLFAAVELYGFCPDVIDQGPEDATVGALADVLRQSTVWYLWWD